MKKTLIANIVRSTAWAGCLTFVLWGFPGCDGSENGHDDTEASHAGDTHDDADGHADHVEGDAHAADDHGDHGGAVEYSAPLVYSDAIEVIHGQLEKIENLLATGGLNQVHEEAAVIRDVANGIGQLAMKAGSGVPREAVREINLAAKALAASFGPIDEAGDSGDLAGTQTIFEEMMALFATLEKFAPNHADAGH